MDKQAFWESLLDDFYFYIAVPRFPADWNISSVPRGKQHVALALSVSKRSHEPRLILLPYENEGAKYPDQASVIQVKFGIFEQFRLALVIQALAGKKYQVTEAMILSAISLVSPESGSSEGSWIPDALGAEVYKSIMSHRIPVEVIELAKRQIVWETLSPEALTREVIAGTIDWDPEYESLLGCMSPADYLRDKEIEAGYEAEYRDLVAEMVALFQEEPYQNTMLYMYLTEDAELTGKAILELILEAIRLGVDDELLIPVALARILTAHDNDALSMFGSLTGHPVINETYQVVVDHAIWASCAVAATMAKDFVHFDMTATELANAIFPFAKRWDNLESVPFVRRASGELEESEESEETEG